MRLCCELRLTATSHSWECADSATGGPRYVICAVGRGGTDFVFTPFGHLADGNPFDAYVPPSATLPDEPTP